MSRQIIFPKTRTTRELRKRVPLAPNPEATGALHGFSTKADGQEEIFYEVSLDLSGLDQMARIAAGNRSQKSNDGPLQVKILSRRKI